MKKKPTLEIISAILLSITIILSTAYLISSCNLLHQKFLRRYDVHNTFPDIDLKTYNSQVLDYLKGKQESLPEGIPFNERELSHMEDVRNTFSTALITLNTALILTIIAITTTLYLNKKSIKKILFYSGAIVWAFSLMLILFFSLAFTQSFTFLHSLFFKEGSWLFSSADNLIKLYPLGFFKDIIITILIIQLIIATILLFDRGIKGFKKMLAS
jgi:integral membrane protein (TIGR01906 family)